MGKKKNLLPKQLLMIPGPVKVSPEVFRAGTKLIGHRCPEFGVFLEGIVGKLQKVFKTKEDIYILTSSGTGAMEAAVVNTVDKRDNVLVVSCGKFGERFDKLANMYAGKVTTLSIPWGKGARPGEVKKFVKKTKADVLLIQHNETCTAITNPLGEIAEEVADETFMVVDGISSIGGVPYYHDKWGIGISLSGSQKALAVPPGLAFIALSKKAWERIDDNRNPKYYFDLNQYKKYYEKKKQTPYTPAVTTIISLDRALDTFLQGGTSGAFKRQRKVADAVRAGIEELGLEFFAEKEYRSDMLTAVKAEGFDVKKMIGTMRTKHGILIAGGQDALSGKIFRVGHMGALTDADILSFMRALKASLKVAGYEPKGDPVSAARRALK